MRMRVLYVEGMQRPLLVLDRLGPLTSEEAQTTIANTRAGIAADVLVSQHDVELPQVDGSGER